MEVHGLCATYPNVVDDARWGDRMKAATDRVQRKTNYAAAEECRRWDLDGKERKNCVNARAADNVLGVLETVVRKIVV